MAAPPRGRGLSRPAWALVALYAAAVVHAYANLLASHRIYFWHVGLFALSAVLFAFPRLIRPRGAIVARPAHFVVVGVIWSSFVAMPLATLLRGEGTANVFVTNLVWLGGCAALTGVWAWLLRWRAWHPLTLFMVIGCIAFAEPGLALLRLLAAGEWRDAALLFPVLHATHAALLAPVAAAYRRSFIGSATPSAAPAAIVVAIAASGATFLLASLAWLQLMRVVLGAMMR
jgi:hypothetical protein